MFGVVMHDKYSEVWIVVWKGWMTSAICALSCKQNAKQEESPFVNKQTNVSVSLTYRMIRMKGVANVAIIYPGPLDELWWQELRHVLGRVSWQYMLFFPTLPATWLERCVTLKAPWGHWESRSRVSIAWRLQHLYSYWQLFFSLVFFVLSLIHLFLLLSLCPSSSN